MSPLEHNPPLQSPSTLEWAVSHAFRTLGKCNQGTFTLQKVRSTCCNGQVARCSSNLSLLWISAQPFDHCICINGQLSPWFCILLCFPTHPQPSLVQRMPILEIKALTAKLMLSFPGLIGSWQRGQVFL